MRPLTSAYKRAALWTTGLTLGSTALIGLLHLPAARGMLRQVGGCPVGETIDAPTRDAARLDALSAVRGQGPAPSRPGPLVALGTSTRADVLNWAAQSGVRCDGEEDLTCYDVPADAWGGPATASVLNLEVDANGRVVGAALSLRGLDPTDATAAFTTLATSLEDQVGPPTDARGEAQAGWLAAAPMRQALRRHRFADYRAELTATNTVGGEIVVRGIYQALTR